MTSPFNDQCFHHIETSHLICRANQLTGFYVMGTLVGKGLIVNFEHIPRNTQHIDLVFLFLL